MNKKNTKKQKKISNSRGFTLIELLATIAILSIVSTIVVYTSINLIDSGKQKSYETTINNVQNAASNYIIEYPTYITWLDGDISDYQYQCLKVKDLIDAGYFKSDVLESKVNNNQNLKLDNYIYLERNKTTKAITKNILLYNTESTELDEQCNSINTYGNISFELLPKGWAKEKEVTITYKLYNYKDDISSYSYDYSFEDLNFNNNFSKNLSQETVKVNKNGDLNASIKKENENITSNTLSISKVDNTKPKLEVTVPNNKEYSKNKTATIKLIDNESGFKVGENIIKYEWSTTPKKCDELSNSTKIVISNDNQKEGTTNVTIENKTGSGKLYVCGKNISDYVENVEDEILISTDMYLDNTKPVITDKYTGDNTITNDVTIPLVLTDEHSGIEENSFTEEDVTVTIAGNIITTKTLSKVDNNNYNLEIKNNNYNGELKIVIDTNKFFDNAGNGNARAELNPGVNFVASYTISYNANGGENAPSSQTKIHGIDLKLSSAKPKRTGYTFLGWSTSSTATSTEYKLGGEFTTDEDTILYAVWRVNKVTIKYSVNGGTITPKTTADGNNYAWTTDTNGLIYRSVNGAASSLFTYGFNYGAKLSSTGLANYNNSVYVNISQTGYTAVSGAEWKCIGGDCISGKTYDQNEIYDVSEFCDARNGDCEAILGVNWTVKTYTIKYYCINGTNSCPSNTSVEYGSDYTIPSDIPTNSDGYTFISWNTKEDGTGNRYAPGYTFDNVTDDIKLYGSMFKISASFACPSSVKYATHEPFNWKLDSSIMGYAISGYTVKKYVKSDNCAIKSQKGPELGYCTNGWETFEKIVTTPMYISAFCYTSNEDTANKYKTTCSHTIDAKVTYNIFGTDYSSNVVQCKYDVAP